MKQIDRELFDKLKLKGLVIETYKNKNFYISCQKKSKGKRKKIYICEKTLYIYYESLSDKKYKKKNRV